MPALARLLNLATRTFCLLVSPRRTALLSFVLFLVTFTGQPPGRLYFSFR